jgi:hypothetical protein
MSTHSQVILGTVGVVVAAVVTEPVPAGGSLWMLLTAILVLAVVVGGRRLPLIFRVVATGFTFDLAYQMCLIGRTMEPFLSAYTIGMALTHFGIFAALPTLGLVRAWEGRPRWLVVSLLLPVAFICACSVAAFEESRFIAQHRSGVGPTGRWTVPHHWLSSDASTGRLSGSD